MPDPRPVARRLDRRRLLALAGGAAGVLSLRPFAARAQPTDVARATLGNGLVVIAERRPIARSVALQLTARAGSRDDGALPGLNAFTLNAMFGGTGRRPSQIDLIRAATLVGGFVDASYGIESSALAALIPAADAATGFDLLADIAGDPLLAPATIAGLKAAVAQVLASRRLDPETLLADVYTAAIFAGHPAGTPAEGTAASIAAISRGDVVAAHGRLWAGANLVLTVVGDIDPEEALALAERHFGSLPAGAPNERPPASPAPRTAPETIRRPVGEQQVQFRIGFHAPSLRSEDRYPMAVLNAIMGGGGGRFFVEIRSELGLAYSATSSNSALTDTGSWSAFAGTEPASLERALTAARDLIRQIRDEPVSESLVGQKIAQIAGSQILADETNLSRAARLAAVQVLGDVSTEEFVRRAREVTPGDVQRVAQAYLDLDRALTVIVGPPSVA